MKSKSLLIALLISVALNLYLLKSQLDQKFLIHNYSSHGLHKFKLVQKMENGDRFIKEVGKPNKNEKTLIYLTEKGTQDIDAIFEHKGKKIKIECGYSTYGVAVRLMVPSDPTKAKCLTGGFRVID